MGGPYSSKTNEGGDPHRSSYIDKNGRVIRESRPPEARFRHSSNSVPRSTSGTGGSTGRTGADRRESEEVMRKLLLFSIVGLLLFGLVSLSDVDNDEADPDRYRQNTSEREFKDAEELYDNGAPAEGMRDVLYGKLELYPESNYPYKLQHRGGDIPIDMENGSRYLGRSVKMTVEYTGDGRKFDIETLEILE